jgi:tetratricopeptide (TPR) repeat protein
MAAKQLIRFLVIFTIIVLFCEPVFSKKSRTVSKPAGRSNQKISQARRSAPSVPASRSSIKAVPRPTIQSRPVAPRPSIQSRPVAPRPSIQSRPVAPRPQISRPVQPRPSSRPTVSRRETSISAPRSQAPKAMSKIQKATGKIEPPRSALKHSTSTPKIISPINVKQRSSRELIKPIAPQPKPKQSTFRVKKAPSIAGPLLKPKTGGYGKNSIISGTSKVVGKSNVPVRSGEKIAKTSSNINKFVNLKQKVETKGILKKSSRSLNSDITKSPQSPVKGKTEFKRTLATTNIKASGGHSDKMLNKTTVFGRKTSKMLKPELKQKPTQSRVFVKSSADGLERKIAGKNNRLLDLSKRNDRNRSIIDSKTSIERSRGDVTPMDTKNVDVTHRTVRKLYSNVAYEEGRDIIKNYHHRRNTHIYRDYHGRLCHRITWPRYHFPVYYSYGPRISFRYFYPYYHRKYVFVSIGGYWPVSYRYVRYYWYGYHPYEWYGYYPVPYEVQNDTYNYYTYNYYNTGDSGTTVANVVPGTLPPVDENTFADVRERLAQQQAQEPEPATLADTYFEQAVKAFENGEYDSAAELFAKAMELASEDIILPYAYAQALFAAEHYSDAVDVLRLALEKVEPEDEGVFYPRGLYPDDEILFAQVKQLAEKAELNSVNYDLQLLLGYQLLGIGEFDQAVGPLEQARQDLRNNQAVEILFELLESIRDAGAEE